MGQLRDWSMKEARRLVRGGAERLGLPVKRAGLEVLKKGDPRKVVLALLLRRHTVASNEWIAERFW